MDKFTDNKEMITSIALIVIPVTLLFITVILTRPDVNNTDISEKTTTQEEIINHFADIKIEGKAAIVKDLNTGKILYSKNKDLPLPLASITKVLTALTVAENTDDIDSDVVSISYKDIQTDGNSLLFVGERFFKKDLINLTLVSSSNDGAAALAASTFASNSAVKEMNKTARKIGMTNSYFYNETGLDNTDTTAGAHGSATDVATLFEYTLINHPEVLESTKDDTVLVKSLTGLFHQVKNTNKITGELPNLVASKTGYTEVAGGNLAVVIDPGLNRPIAIVVLSSSEEGRFADVNLLAKTAVSYFTN